MGRAMALAIAEAGASVILVGREEASLVQTASEAGARIVILNAEETPFDHMADAVIRDPIGTVLPQLVAY